MTVGQVPAVLASSAAFSFLFFFIAGEGGGAFFFLSLGDGSIQTETLIKEPLNPEHPTTGGPLHTNVTYS